MKNNNLSLVFMKDYLVRLIFNNNLEVYYVPVNDLIENEKKKLNYKNLKTNFLISGEKNSKIMGTLIHEKKYIYHI